jgi:hypothetical protein
MHRSAITMDRRKWRHYRDAFPGLAFLTVMTYLVIKYL